MADTESIRQAAQTRLPFSAWLGVLLLFSLFGIIALAVVGPSPRGTDFEKIRIQKRLTALKAVQDEAATLTSYAWVDKSKGVARIPIEQAMELTVAELSHKKPAAAYPIATPSPAAAEASPAAAASSAPGPAASPSTAAKAAPRPPNQLAAPGAQPGAGAPPAAPSASAPVSPAPAAKNNAPGTPAPVRGKDTPSPSPQ